MAENRGGFECAIRGALHEMGKRARVKIANRDAILAAARAVFAAQGYAGTNIRDIIRHTNLAAGTFYNYFKTKEQVYHEVHADAAARFRPILRQARETAGDDLEQFLYLACRHYFEFVLAQPPLHAEVANNPAIVKVRLTTPETDALFAELREDLQHYPQIASLDAVSIEIVTASCFGTAEELGALVIAQKLTDIDAVARKAARLFMAGIPHLA